jgi:hypothetical protein
MPEDYLNLWVADQKIPEKANVVTLSVSGEVAKDAGKRWKTINGLVNMLTRKGHITTHVPINLRQKFQGDVVVISTNAIDAAEIMQDIPRLEGATLKAASEAAISSSEFPSVFANAWQTWFRETMRRIGFLHHGLGTYVATDQLAQASVHKSAFRISPELIDGVPALWIDPETRVMVPLSYQEAASATEGESVPVRVLMDWKSAFVIGAYNENVSQFKDYNLEEHWRYRGIPVKPTHRVFKVEFGDQLTTYAYPEACVFKEYQRGKKELAGRKYKPSERVGLVQRFLAERLSKVGFLETTFTFSPEPAKAIDLGYEKGEFEFGHAFQVLLRRGANVYPISILDVKSSFEKGAEPYTGKQSGSYVVICPEELAQKIGPALRAIERAYQNLNMGSINQLLPTRFVKGNKYNDYQEAFNLIIQDILFKSSDTKHIIAFVVLPNVAWENSIYFEAKRVFFNPSAINEDVKPMQIQCIESNTIDKIIADKRYIIENIVPQLYLKLYGKHAALWLSRVPADTYVYPESPAVTAYACFDVSRRKKLKSQVSVFTAVTDGYGRFISFDSIPSGGERLTELSFYILIERIATMCKAYATQFAKIEPNLSFNLHRIVLYKDGRVEWNERDMMFKVFNNGVPEEGREPIRELFAKRKDLPQNLAIDIVSVNKSPNRRIFSKFEGSWKNPRRGTYYRKSGEDRCLLVSSQTHKIDNEETITVKPLQLELIHHFDVNSKLPTPNIRAIAQEYYHLTFLDWVSFYQKSKFALPQRITQKTGEFLSAQVNIPKEVVVL